MQKRVLIGLGIVVLLAIIVLGAWQFGTRQLSANATTDAWNSKLRACGEVYRDNKDYAACLTAIPTLNP